MTPLNIGITGFNGFIGSSVAKKLSDEGHNVVSLDHYTRNENPVECNSNSFLSDLNWVMHFGASTSIHDSFDKPFDTYSNNLLSTLVATQIASESKCPLLFMSSYVYGNPEYLPIDEKHPTSPLNPYMGSKIAGEEICKQINKLLDIPIVIFRAFNIYGNQNSPGRLLPDLINAINLGEPLIVQDPAPRRDYLYIKDFTALILRLINCEFSGLEIFNVGCGKSYSNYEVAEIIQSIARKKLQIIVKDKPRKNDVIDCYADISLVKKTFSWSPSYNLKQGLRELLNS